MIEIKKVQNKITAVDFDGTLCETAKYPGIGRPNHKLIRHLINERLSGGKLILWTCRSGDALTEAIVWCHAHGLFFDAVNDNLPEIIEAFGNNPRKIFANEYIDDLSSTKWELPFKAKEEPDLWLTTSFGADALPDRFKKELEKNIHGAWERFVYFQQEPVKEEKNDEQDLWFPIDLAYGMDLSGAFLKQEEQIKPWKEKWWSIKKPISSVDIKIKNPSEKEETQHNDGVNALLYSLSPVINSGLEDIYKDVEAQKLKEFDRLFCEGLRRSLNDEPNKNDYVELLWNNYMRINFPNNEGEK